MNQNLVELRPMHGFMHGFTKKLFQTTLSLLFAILICALIAFLAAYQARSEYRIYFDFSGEEPGPVSLEEILSEQENSTSYNSETFGFENEYLNTALDFAGEAKNWTADQLKDNPLTDSYNKLNNDYNLLKFKILKLAELVIFWLSFVLSFLTTAFILSKLSKLKDSLTEKTDPAVEENIIRLAEAVNHLNNQMPANPPNVQNSPNIPNPSMNG